MGRHKLPPFFHMLSQDLVNFRGNMACETGVGRHRRKCVTFARSSCAQSWPGSVRAQPSVTVRARNLAPQSPHSLLHAPTAALNQNQNGQHRHGEPNHGKQGKWHLKIPPQAENTRTLAHQRLKKDGGFPDLARVTTARYPPAPADRETPPARPRTSHRQSPPASPPSGPDNSAGCARSAASS